MKAILQQEIDESLSSTRMVGYLMIFLVVVFVVGLVILAIKFFLGG